MWTMTGVSASETFLPGMNLLRLEKNLERVTDRAVLVLSLGEIKRIIRARS